MDLVFWRLIIAVAVSAIAPAATDHRHFDGTYSFFGIHGNLIVVLVIFLVLAILLLVLVLNAGAFVCIIAIRDLALWQNLNVYGFSSFAQACSAGGLTIMCPAQPAVILRVDSVPY
jgi:hypothetical protein